MNQGCLEDIVWEDWDRGRRAVGLRQGGGSPESHWRGQKAGNGLQVGILDPTNRPRSVSLSLSFLIFN